MTNASPEERHTQTDSKILDFVLSFLIVWREAVKSGPCRIPFHQFTSNIYCRPQSFTRVGIKDPIINYFVYFLHPLRALTKSDNISRICYNLPSEYLRKFDAHLQEEIPQGISEPRMFIIRKSSMHFLKQMAVLGAKMCIIYKQFNMTFVHNS